MASLTQQDARQRGELITVSHYQVDLDLDTGPETFESVSRARFSARTPGARTFLDIKAEAVHGLTLNGSALDVRTVRDGVVSLPNLARDNEVVVRATMRYSRDGQGLHRGVDPADQLPYVYGHLFLDAAPRVFACFDQPDLKSPYDIRVVAPRDWIVVGNGAATAQGDGSWVLATTRPLATYFVTVCAGPYATVSGEHDGIPLHLHARRSLRGALERQASQILDITGRSFDYYHQLFGIRYPFGEYHQVFAPEFNAGAMENPGCVVLRDRYIFRGAATRSQIMTRSNTVAHEMAHMWFGDLVTMRWWDDLWLNESFAEYMSHRTLAAATEFTDAWVSSSMIRKVWGYAAERMPSTHSVAGSPAPDSETALQNFDGISYAKGAATLRQLIAYIGDEAFLSGVAGYLREHSYGNASLSDFIAAMELAGSLDLSDWVKGWLLTAGRDRIDVRATVSGGRVDRALAVRTAPAEHPASRPHAMDVAGYADGQELYRVGFTLESDSLELEALAGRPAPRVMLPNASDLTWAHVVLDEATMSALPEQLAQIGDPAARAVAWSALLDAVATSAVDPRLFVRTFAAAWPKEDDDSINEILADLLLARVIPTMLPIAEQPAAYAAVDRAARTLAERVAQGSSPLLVAMRLRARCSQDEAMLGSWAAGDGLPSTLKGDDDFRWLVVINLAGQGLLDDAAIDAVLESDNTMTGNLSALQAKAARPVAEAKAWAWDQLTGRNERSNYERNALAAGFWRAPRLHLVRPYVARFFSDVPRMAQWVGQDALASLVRAAYPLVVVEEETSAATVRALDSGALSPAVFRQVADGHAMLLEALRSRRTFPPEQSPEREARPAKRDDTGDVAGPGRAQR